MNRNLSKQKEIEFCRIQDSCDYICYNWWCYNKKHLIESSDCCTYRECCPTLEQAIEDALIILFKVPISLEKEKALKILQDPNLKRKYASIS